MTLAPLLSITLFLLVVAVHTAAIFITPRDRRRDEEVQGKLITPEQLEKANGVDTDNLWVAIFGKVYDVRTSPDYYGKGGEYSEFTARDATVMFAKGVDTVKQATEHWSVIEERQLPNLEKWTKFFDEKYPLVGFVVGEFYDDKGYATRQQNLLQERIEEANRNGFVVKEGDCSSYLFV